MMYSRSTPNGAKEVSGLRNRTPSTTTAVCLLSLAGLLVAVLLAGCGSDYWEDEDDDYYPNSRDKTVHIYLNISDQDGQALPDVTVWVDGTKQTEKSSDEYSRLGNQFPADWRGWEYNWRGGPYFFDVWRCSRRVCSIEVMVSRSGYQSQKTHITFDQYDPNEIYFRQTFVMEESSNSSAAPAEAPQPAEKTSL